MAIATKKDIIPPPQPPPTYVVTLTLSKEEAEVLATVLNHVGGPPEGKRGLATGIMTALKDAGVYVDIYGRNDGVSLDHRTIKFL